jgi:ATP-dependent Clp protease protease subunit
MIPLLNADKTEILLYGPIGAMYGERAVTAKAFRAALDNFADRPVTLRVSSEGGSVTEAVMMYNMAKEHPFPITTIIDGLAASAMTYLVEVAQVRKMAANAMFMIHDPMGATLGDAEEHRKTAEVLDKLKETIVGMYRDRSGNTEQQVRAWMTAETWFTADEAKESGFVDEVIPNVDAKGATPFKNLLNFRNVPAGWLAAMQNAGTPRLDRLAALFEAA